MIVRVLFDAGHSWKSWYFLDVSRSEVEKMTEELRVDRGACWCFCTSWRDNIFEIRARFDMFVHFRCVDVPGFADNVQRQKALNNAEFAHKVDSCALRFMSGRCKNPFVVKNLGQVLLPNLYGKEK